MFMFIHLRFKCNALLLPSLFKVIFYLWKFLWVRCFIFQSITTLCRPDFLSVHIKAPTRQRTHL